MDVIKLNSLDRWRLLEKGKLISFAGRHMRRVRLHVNCAEETALILQLDGGVLRLLTVVPAGLSCVEFNHAGGFGVWPESEAEFWFHTAEDEPTSIASLGTSFTTIHQRPARNLELERIMFAQEQNQKRREAVLLAEIAKLVGNKEGKANGKESESADGVHGRKAAKHPKPEKAGKAGVPVGDGRDPGGARPAAAAGAAGGAAEGGEGGDGSATGEEAQE